jgi:hypothetical protein
MYCFQRCLHCLYCTPAGDREWGYGVVVSVFRKQQQDRQGVAESAAAAYVVDTLLCCARQAGGGGKQQAQAPRPAALAAADAEMQVRLSLACTALGAACKVLHCCFTSFVHRDRLLRPCCLYSTSRWSLRCQMNFLLQLNSTVWPVAAPSDCLQVVPVPLPLLTDICTLRVSIPADLRPAESRNAGTRACGTVLVLYCTA